MRTRCSYCGESSREKLASLYWAWFASADDRRAFKTRSCPECLRANFQQTFATYNAISTDESTCIGCGGSSGDDGTTVYLTLYVPKREQTSYELDFDAACVAVILASIIEHGSPLENRRGPGKGQGPEAPDPWQDLEL